MKLLDLFEAEFKPLEPGEKRPESGLGLRDIAKIQNRIYDLQYHLDHSKILKNTYQQDTQLQQSLERLIRRLELKKQYLEKMKDRPTGGTERMIGILEQQCSDFMSSMMDTNSFLFRGVRSEDSVFQGRSREDRQPKDSYRAVTETFDHMLEQLGFAARRSNSIFTTTNYDFASNYGHQVYIIMPKNGFAFTTTNKRDLILDTMSQLADNDAIDSVRQELMTFMTDNVENWRSTRLGQGVYFSDFTTMFYELKKNFANNNTFKLPEKFDNLSLEKFITPESVQKNFEPNQTDLDSAMRSGYEILINGEYWALRNDQWNSVLSEHFFGTGYTKSHFDQYF